MDKKIKNIIDRINQDGVTITMSDRKLRHLTNKYDGIFIYSNRKHRESIIFKNKDMINEFTNWYRKKNNK